jgi:16S rRNA (cytidine1402-2'-O)-methyltransferase
MRTRADEEDGVPLVFVPTPLGNLRDITLRALDVLRDCDLLVAEDTRTARRLFNALALPPKPTWSYREQNATAATAAILARAASERVAVVTDAGMPGISDPGRDLVVAARAAGVAVEVLPGPCAFVCAAVLSGFDLAGFSFAGFVPRAKGERERAIRAAIARGATTLWYESPNRIVATLETIDAVAPAAPLFLARELTKLHEQHIAGTASEALAALERPPRGEIVLALGPVDAEPNETSSADEIDAAIDLALASGATVATVARDLARSGLGSRAELYRRASQRRTLPGTRR